MMREDTDFLAICSDELIAKEVMYHHMCYKSYVKVTQTQVNKPLPVRNCPDDPESCAYVAVVQGMYLLFDHPEVLEFTALTEILETNFVEGGLTNHQVIKSAKKNLRRKLENTYA